MDPSVSPSSSSSWTCCKTSSGFNSFEPRPVPPSSSLSNRWRRFSVRPSSLFDAPPRPPSTSLKRRAAFRFSMASGLPRRFFDFAMKDEIFSSQNNVNNLRGQWTKRQSSNAEFLLFVTMRNLLLLHHVRLRLDLQPAYDCTMKRINDRRQCDRRDELHTIFAHDLRKNPGPTRMRVELTDE